MHRTAHASVFLLLLILSLVAPSRVQAQRAIPQLSGPVVDEAGILSDLTERQLTATIEAHEDSTSNQLAVLTISSLEGDVLEEYSLRVARTWGLGQADKDNGVLILVAVAERKIRIEVGYGLEGDLPDITARRIIDREMTPYFREGDFDGGVLHGVHVTLDAIAGSYTPSGGAVNDSPLTRWLVGLMLGLLPLIVVVRAVMKPGLVLFVAALFGIPFIGAAGFVVYPPYGALIALAAGIALLFSLKAALRNSPDWVKTLREIAEAKPGDTVPIVIRGKTLNIRIPEPSSDSHSGGSSSSGGFSSGSSSSGGGGSFGGGGASGGW